MSFSSVVAESPSIFMRVFSQKCANFCTSLAAQWGLTQYNCRVPPLVRLTVRGSSQQGQVIGSAYVLLGVLLSAICGMIMFALYTRILSPIPNWNSSKTSRLCRYARPTSVPSMLTGSNKPVMLTIPVLVVASSTPRKCVSYSSSSHLSAISRFS